jgi:glycerol-3-phosphate dehydrogenase
MVSITRNLDHVCRDSYDVIIIGGGIYGSMLLLEATGAGLKAILLEKDDFGGLTSFNSLRIVHGGLRYLQTLHLSRLHESVTERSWFLRTFPDLVRPLPCLMPLYRNLTKNRLTLRAALRVNDWLTRKRNEGLPSEFQIPDGQIIGAAETRRLFPLVRSKSLRGAALWYDAVMPDSNRVLMEVLRWSASAGGTSVNYIDVTNLLQSDGMVRGVIAKDVLTGSDYEIEASLVVNAAGPECGAVAQRFSEDRPALFRPSLAWNALLDRPPLSDGAVAVQAPTGNSRIYFAHSLGGRLFVGTGHAPVDGNSMPDPTEADMSAMLEDLNRAVPGIDLNRGDIRHIFSGQLPAKRCGSVDLTREPVILDHGREGGPQGLFSVSGVKFTTARHVASRLVQLLGAQTKDANDPGLCDRPPPAAYDLCPMSCTDRAERLRRARTLIEDEAPQSLTDLLIRRSNLVGDAGAAMSIAEDCCTAFGWDSEQSNLQINELSAFYEQRAPYRPLRDLTETPKN